MATSGVGKNNMGCKIGLGATIGASIGLPDIIKGTKNLSELNKNFKKYKNNLIEFEKIPKEDILEQIKTNPIISTSKKEVQEFCERINKETELDKSIKKASEAIEGIDKILRKGYKSDIMNGFKKSAIWATIIGCSIGLIGKLKQNKTNNQNNS